MAHSYDSFEIVGWEDYSGDRHIGEVPSAYEIEAVYGLLIHAWNDSDPEEQRHFWLPTGESFDDWDSWLYYILDALDQYNQAT